MGKFLGERRVGDFLGEDAVGYLLLSFFLPRVLHKSLIVQNEPQLEILAR